MKGPQDIVRSLIEVPKNLVEMVDMNLFQRESLLAQMRVNSMERFYAEEMHAQDVLKFKMGDQHEREMTNVNYSWSLGSTIASTIQKTVG